MSEKIEKLPRMNTADVRTYVSNAYSNAVRGSSRCHDELIRYYAEGAKSPSIAHLIFKDEFKKSAKKIAQANYQAGGKSLSHISNDIIEASDFINKADRSDKVKPFLDDFTASWKVKYPRTKEKRRFIVENGFVVWDKVTKKTFFSKYWKRFLYGRFLKTL